jgi:hypothetical protein
MPSTIPPPCLDLRILCMSVPLLRSRRSGGHRSLFTSETCGGRGRGGIGSSKAVGLHTKTSTNWPVLACQGPKLCFYPVILCVFCNIQLLKILLAGSSCCRASIVLTTAEFATTRPHYKPPQRSRPTRQLASKAIRSGARLFRVQWYY